METRYFHNQARAQKQKDTPLATCQIQTRAQKKSCHPYSLGFNQADRASQSGWISLYLRQ
jgi:hypothetical protein